MIKFNAHKSKTILSRTIQICSRGRFSHISIELDGYVYEAVWKRGVIKTKRSLWDGSTVYSSVILKLPHEKEAKVWLEKQLGKKYDFMGVFSFVFSLMKPRKGYFFCSELAVVALAKAKGVVENLDNQKVSPDLFWGILKFVV